MRRTSWRILVVRGSVTKWVSLTETTADIDAGDAVMKPNDEAVLSK